MATQDGNPTTVNDAEAKQQEAADAQKEMQVMDVMMKQTQEQSVNRGACACCDNMTRKINLAIEDAFYKLGLWIGKCPCIVLIITLAILILCCIGLGNLQLEQDITNLWTPTDSPIWEENKFIDKYWGNDGGGLFVFVAESKNAGGNIFSSQHLSEWYDFNIKLKTDIPTIDYKFENENEEIETLTFGLFYEDFYPVEDLITLGEYGADGVTVPHYASKVIPFCKPAVFSPVEAQFQVPCAQLSLFDCFSEGGEFFPYDNYLSMTMFAKLAPANPYTYLRSSFDGMDLATLGDLIGLSCPTFMGTRLPYNNLYGGETRVDALNKSSRVTEIKTWETVVLMDSVYGLAKKIKIGTRKCKYTVTLSFECPEITDEDMDEAKELYFEWLGLVIDWGLNEITEWENDKNKQLKITMWNDRSGPDLLAEASSADFVLIFISYFAMIIFAALTAFRPNNLFLSKSESSFFGVVLVVLSVAATMGLAGSFVKLAPEASNVIPFIAIGFGVDDMFVLIFAYKFRENLSVPQMIAETVRIAGSSVALTSIANFLAFLISTQMVLPSVANFATFGTLVVLLNFISVIFGFTAVLSLTARRQKSGYRDWSFICCFNDCTKYEPETNPLDTSPNSPSASNADMLPQHTNHTNNNNDSTFEPFFNILIKTPVRIFCLLLCIILFIIGCAGVNLIEVGLPLQEIVPKDSYAADFLAVRVEYYTTQSFSLYTDADGTNGKHKGIDWPNRFEDWLDTINKIHDISPLVYDGMDVHSFWALGFQKYLQKAYVKSSLSDHGYELGEAFIAPDDTIYSSTLCESDRISFCPTIGSDYFFPSPIFLCLYANQQYLNDKCMDYLFTLLPDSFFEDYTWAHQLYITSFDENNLNITGLYVKSDRDETNVFYKYPCNNIQCDGYIFQEECTDAPDYCKWLFLDNEFNLLYIGDRTPTDIDELSSIPAQNGWKDAMTGRPAKITQNYLDFGVAWFEQTRQLENFIYWDVPIITEFHYTGQTIWEYKLMKKLMSSSVTAYKSVSLGTFNSQIQCNAVLEATEICGAIRNNVSPQYINCGGIEQSATDTNWWIGQCPNNNNGFFAMIATTLDSATVNDITPQEACECGTSNSQLNHLSGNLSATADLDCFNPSETVSITCSQFTECNDLSSCYEEFEEFTLLNLAQCNITNLETFEEEYNLDADNVITYASEYLAPCLFSYYDLLSDCCVSSIKSVLLDVDDIEFSCADIDNFITNINLTDSKESVCNSKDRCLFNSDTLICENNCYGNVLSDCSSLIYQEAAGGTFGPPIITNYSILLLMADPDSCCRESLDTAASLNIQDCIVPKPGYWNYASYLDYTFSYDYSICDDLLIQSLANNSAPCGTVYNPAGSLDMTVFPGEHKIDNQLACIYSNIDTLAAGCCKNRILQIVSDTRIISRECEIDVNTYCQNCDYGPCFGLSFAVGMYNQSSQCAKDIISKAQIGALSPKCLLAFLYCPLDSVWPITFGNTTANETCGAGYSGYQTRLCDNSLGYADWSSVIDRSECHILRCPSEIGPYGQLWPETTVNYIATAQGGYDKLNNFSQVGEGLQSESINGECSFLLGSTYYARRKCQISPFFGTAEWLNPIVECRPAIAFTWPIKFEKTICDMITEEMTQGQLSGGNLIGVVPWGMIIPFPPGVPEFMQEDIILGYSQQYCEQALTNCVAFSYNSVTKFAFYFDYCGEILTASDLHNGTIPEYFPGYYSIAMYPLGVPTYVPPGYLPWGDIPGNLDTFADYMTTYIAPLSKEQFTGEYCSAMSSFDSNQEFIPASAAWNHNGIPNPYCFYNTLWLYY